jgi:hypothetical protein
MMICGRKSMRVVLVGLVVSTGLAGCSLSPKQRQDIQSWEGETAQRGDPIKYVQERDPNTTLWLTLLPFGVGCFYAGRPGIGVTGIFFWPLSIAWSAPVCTYYAEYRGYESLRLQVVALRREQAQSAMRVAAPTVDVKTRLAQLERLWKEGRISDVEYEAARKKAIGDLAQ